MMDFTPEDYGNQKLFKLLLGGVAPRPIAFASTVDKAGNPNLAPFSFYNAFGVNPARLIFSPSRRGRDNTTKHTLDNLKEVPEVVINAVTYQMVHQMSLTSTDFPKGVNEFEKAGLTPVPSLEVKPFRVKESPLQFECQVVEIVEVSGLPGSGNLVVCDIVRVHLDENVLDNDGEIDPDKIDLVGRLGGDYYVRTSGKAKFVIPKPLTSMGIGVDALPQAVRNSKVLTGNDLGQLGNLPRLPAKEDMLPFLGNNPSLQQVLKNENDVHCRAQQFIDNNKPWEALILLMLFYTHPREY